MSRLFDATSAEVDRTYAAQTEKAQRQRQVWTVSDPIFISELAGVLNAVVEQGGFVSQVLACGGEEHAVVVVIAWHWEE